MRVGQSKKWLVKSNGRVLGPFSDRQVNDLLRDQVIAPLDEVSEPNSRWKYIREEVTFIKAVEDIRQKNLRGLLDESTVGLDTNATQSISHNSSMDELTQEIMQTTLDQVREVRDVSFYSSEEPQNSTGKKTAGPVYTHGGDSRVHAQTQNSARWVWATTILVILAMAGYVVFQKFVSQPIKAKTNLDELAVAGIDAMELGDYRKALGSFQRAYETDPTDTSNFIYLGLLQIQIKGQALEGRKLLEQVLEHENKDLKRVLTAIGLSYLIEGNYKSAESYFNKALDVDPLYSPAVINLGATALYQEDWAKANNNLLLAIKDGSHDGAEHIMLTEVLLKLFEKDKDRKYLLEAQKQLHQLLESGRSYRLEGTIGLTYVDRLLDPKKNVNKDIDRILDLDFDETDQSRYNLMIHRKRADWAVVSQWCLTLALDLDPAARVIALEGLCLYKSGDEVEANRKINDALAQSPRDPLVLATSAYIYNRMNMRPLAAVSIKKASETNENNIYIQPLRQAAKLMGEEGDRDGQIKMWQQVLAKDPSSLDAISELANAYLQLNDLSNAKKQLAEGMRISENYKPLLNLSRTMGRLEDKAKARGL